MDSEKRKKAILDKYGTWERYEEMRAIKLRETALKRCKTEEERQAKIKKFAKEDEWKRSVNPENIGKTLKCSRCGEEFIANKNQHLYCRKCVIALARIENAGSLEAYYEKSDNKVRETKRKKYGTETYNNREQAKETCIEKYGVSHPIQNKEILEKSEKTKFERYGDKHYRNPNKTKKTYLEMYGVDHNWKVPEILEKCKKSMEEKYGSFGNREKAKKTCQEKYGGESPWCNSEVRKKSKNTIKERYGVCNIMEHPYFKEKIKQTTIEKYGVDNIQKLEEFKKRNSIRMTANPPMLNLASREKMMNTILSKYGSFFRCSYYFYNSLYFDSSWELAYYIWLIDTGKEFKYKPPRYEYCIGNSVHFYYPDFIVDNKIIEIKGDHLIQDGTLIDWNTGKKLIEKTNFLKELGVIIIVKKDIMPILKYISNTYGPKYLDQFRIREKK